MGSPPPLPPKPMSAVTPKLIRRVSEEDDKLSSEAGTEYEEYSLTGVTELPGATAEDEKKAEEENAEKEKKLTDEIVKDLESITALTKEHLSTKGLLNEDEPSKKADETTTTSDQIHMKNENKTTTYRETFKSQQTTTSSSSSRTEKISTYTELGPRFTSLTQQMKQALDEMEEQDKRMPYADLDAEKSLDDAIAESTKLDRDQLVDSIQVKTEYRKSDV